MAINAWKKKIWPGANPNAHKRAEGERGGNGVAKKGDTHGMEYKRVKPDSKWDGASRTVDWKK